MSLVPRSNLAPFAALVGCTALSWVSYEWYAIATRKVPPVTEIVHDLRRRNSLAEGLLMAAAFGGGGWVLHHLFVEATR